MVVSYTKQLLPTCIKYENTLLDILKCLLSISLVLCHQILTDLVFIRMQFNKEKVVM